MSESEEKKPQHVCISIERVVALEEKCDQAFKIVGQINERLEDLLDDIRRVDTMSQAKVAAIEERLRNACEQLKQSSESIASLARLTSDVSTRMGKAETDIAVHRVEFNALMKHNDDQDDDINKLKGKTEKHGKVLFKISVYIGIGATIITWVSHTQMFQKLVNFIMSICVDGTPPTK